MESATWPIVSRGTAFEDHLVGRAYHRHRGGTVHASDDIASSSQTLAFDPVYFNRDVARACGLPDELVDLLLVFAVVFGLVVEDLGDT